MGTAVPLGQVQEQGGRMPTKAVPLFDQSPTEVTAADLPEITSQGEIPWDERLGVDLKLMMTGDPWEKARIITKSFPDRAELMVDTETNEPIVALDGKKYLINKKGFSWQDVNDLTAETGAYLPASVLSGGTSILGRLLMGAITYGATDITKQAGTYAVGGKKEGEAPIDLGKAGTVASVGGLVEAAAPPLLKAGGRLIKTLWSKSKFPQMSSAALDAIIAAASTGDADAMRRAISSIKGTSQGNIPMTVGQQTGGKAALETEAMMRESASAYGEGATDVIKKFDDNQLQAIISEAEALQGQVGGGSGFGAEVPSNIGSRLQGDIIAEEAKRKASAGAAQEAKKLAVIESPVYVTGDAFEQGMNNVLSVPRDMGIGAQTLNSMVHAPQIIKRVKTFQKAFERGKITKANYATIMDFTRDIGNRIAAVGAHTPEGAMLTQMKSRTNDMVDEALTKGLVEGDAATIGLVKDANKLWAKYKTDFFKARPDKFGNTDAAGGRIAQILGGETPERVVSFFANVSKNAPKKETRELFTKMEDIFGPESEQIQMIKDAVIYRLFTNANRRGSADITRTDIVKNFTEFFVKNKSLSTVMFKPGEIESIRRFVGNVARTMPAEQMINPSGTGRFIARFFSDMSSGGFLARIGAASKGVPLAANMGGTGYARALAYADRLSGSPLTAIATAAVDKEEGGVPRNAANNLKDAYNTLLGN